MKTLYIHGQVNGQSPYATPISFQPNSVISMSRRNATDLLKRYPDKVCDVTGMETPELHWCPKSETMAQHLSGPPSHRMETIR